MKKLRLREVNGPAQDLTAVSVRVLPPGLSAAKASLLSAVLGRRAGRGLGLTAILVLYMVLQGDTPAYGVGLGLSPQGLKEWSSSKARVTLRF